MAIKYIGSGPSRVSIDGVELVYGDVLHKPRSLVEQLLSLDDWVDADSTADRPEPPPPESEPETEEQ